MIEVIPLFIIFKDLKIDINIYKKGLFGMFLSYLHAEIPYELLI